MSDEEHRATTAGTVTDPAAADPRLRGRTYAIPFDRVWRSALALAGGELGGWSLVRADDRAGVIEAVRKLLLRKERDRVVVEIGLDENAQTRVDLRCVREGARPAVRSHARLADHFCRALDRALGARSSHILDPTRVAPWTEGAGS